MNKNDFPFVSFEPTQNNFKAYLSLDGFILKEQNYEKKIQKAVKVYEEAVNKMRIIIADMNQFKQKYRRLPAQKVWSLGDEIFQLIDDLTKLSLQIDGLYAHLTRDLGSKRKWLEKVIIFRRYMPDKKPILESMNWSKFEKGTRKVTVELYRKHIMNQE